MGSGSWKSPAYPSKEEFRKRLVSDVAIVLNDARLTDRTKRVVCLEAFSAWTELDGKHKGCRYWSKGALQAEEPAVLLGGRLLQQKNLRHEHAVPKKVLWEGLQQFESLTEKMVRYYFDYIVGVVVTLEEEKRLNDQFKSKMPEDFWDEGSPSYLDALLRYKRCVPEIEIVKLTWYGPRRRVKSPEAAVTKTFEPFRMLPRRQATLFGE